MRIQYSGAVYHVMARGNHGQPVYRNDADRLRFLETLAEACEKTGWRVYAYVLITNHNHLLPSKPEGTLVEGMKWLQGTYTQRLNGRQKVFGHLFQGRYQALILDSADAQYLPVVSTYIHLNPVGAGLVPAGKNQLRKFRWSSYPASLSQQCPTWLSRAEVLGSLGPTEPKRRGYEAYLEGRILEGRNQARRPALEEEWKRVRPGWYLGEESFLEKLEAWLERARSGRKRESHSGGAGERHDWRGAERLLAKGLKVLGLKASDLEALPLRAPEKLALAWWLRRQTTVSSQWVAERLKLGHSTSVTQAV